jgi:prepilin-type N-terminal cleavage/methylation domain-containing protein
MTISLSQRRQGFTLVEIMIVVAVIGLILAIAVPAWVKTRSQARKNMCIEQISQIESAKQQWGVETGKKDGDVPTDADLFGSNLYMKARPMCPGGGTYDLQPIGRNAICSQAPTEGHAL